MYGIPATCVSDNGGQFDSEEFSQKWQFTHVTSSPTYPQSNGKAEQAVKSAKQQLKKAKKSGSDPYLAVLACRNTPTQGFSTSAAQRLMSRRTNTLLPATEMLLQPAVPAKAMEEMNRNKTRQASYYNQHARDLPELEVGDIVRFIPPSRDRSSRQEQIKAPVRARMGSRLYVIVTEDGREFRRNRKHPRKTTERFRSILAANNAASTVAANSAAPTVTANSAAPTVAANQAASTVAANQAASTVAVNQAASTVAANQAASTVAANQAASTVAANQAASTVAANQAASTMAANQAAPTVAVTQAASTVTPDEAVGDGSTADANSDRETVEANRGGDEVDADSIGAMSTKSGRTVRPPAHLQDYICS